MVTRNTADISLGCNDLSLEIDPMYLARVEKPTPITAPMILRTVASNCCAVSSCTENTNSLSVRTRNADVPPSLENLGMVMIVQHKKVDKTRAIARLVG